MAKLIDLLAKQKAKEIVEKNLSKEHRQERTQSSLDRSFKSNIFSNFSLEELKAFYWTQLYPIEEEE